MSGDEPEKPVSLAVALQYERGVDAAPRVVAKGRGMVAQKIVDKAVASDVAIEGNAMLAEALAGVDIDSQIPEELYRAVAEVIGFVLRTTGQMR